MSLRKLDQDIKDAQRQNYQLSRETFALVKHQTQLHSIAHHRQTMDDESAYQAQVKGSRGEVDRMHAHIDKVRREIEANEQASAKERLLMDQLERRVAEMGRELREGDGGH